MDLVRKVIDNTSQSRELFGVNKRRKKRNKPTKMKESLLLAYFWLTFGYFGLLLVTFGLLLVTFGYFWLLLVTLSDLHVAHFSKNGLIFMLLIKKELLIEKVLIEKGLYNAFTLDNFWDLF